MTTITATAAGVVLDPIGTVARIQQSLVERSRHEVGPLIVFIVAAAILLALGMVLATGAALYCISRGGNLVWFTTNGWKVWEIQVACRLW